MKSYTVKRIHTILAQLKKTDPLVLLKENLIKTAQFIYEDVSLNKFNHYNDYAYLIEEKVRDLSTSEDKEVIVQLNEFLINFILISKEQVQHSFSYLFDVVVRFYDDLDDDIKNSAHNLNDCLTDCISSTIDKNSRISNMLRTIVKCIYETRNERVRLLILEWIYLLDTFPCCDLAQYIDIFIAEFVEFYFDNNIEIVELASNKITEIRRRFDGLFKLDLGKIIKVLEILRTVNARFSDQISRKMEKHLFDLFYEFIQVIVNYYSTAHTQNIRVPQKLSFDVFKLVLLDIYLHQYKVDPSRACQKKIYKTLKLLVKKFRGSLDSQTEIEMKENLLVYYKVFIANYSYSDFSILYEINGLLKMFSASKLEIKIGHLDILIEIVWLLILNNKRKNKMGKLAAFIISKLDDVLTEFFSDNRNKLKIFIQRLMYKAFDKDNKGIIDEIYLHLLYFFNINILLPEILKLFTEEQNFYFHPGKFIKFLYTKAQGRVKENQLALNEYIYKKTGNRIAKAIFGNFSWFLLINIAMGNFITAKMVLEYQLSQLYKKSLDHHKLFNRIVSHTVLELDPIMRDENYNNNGYLLEFLCICLMIIEQNSVFNTLTKFLKSKTQCVRIKIDPIFESEQCELYKIYLKYVETSA